MTYHRGIGGLGDVDGTYKNWGHGDASFRVSGLNGTTTESAKALSKIVAMVKAVPGVVGADGAWGAGGVITVNFRAAAGTPVSGTATTIRRNVAGVGSQIRSGVTVTVTRTGYTPADVDRTVAAPVPDETPALIDGSGGPTPPGYQAPVVATSSMPIWPFAIGGTLLVLGLGTFFILRKKPSPTAAGAT